MFKLASDLPLLEPLENALEQGLKCCIERPETANVSHSIVLEPAWNIPEWRYHDSSQAVVAEYVLLAQRSDVLVPNFTSLYRTLLSFPDVMFSHGEIRKSLSAMSNSDTVAPSAFCGERVFIYCARRERGTCSRSTSAVGYQKANSAQLDPVIR